MHVVHLTASTMFGGPERQMLGLAAALPADDRSTFISFSEGGRCRPFIDAVEARRFDAIALANDFPRLRSTVRELVDRVRSLRADLLLTHGYKANILGRIAARQAGIPIVAVARGWTGENRKVRLYERLDRFHLRFVDRVVAVSEAQAARVRTAGVPDERIEVIRNAARLEAFANPIVDRERLLGLFPKDRQIGKVVLSAGRLSPEKGFDLLVEAAGRIRETDGTTGFVHFGDGIERPKIESAIRERRLDGRFVLAGFTDRLDAILPAADLVVLPSHTEGMPNVLLEAAAAGVACVATRVGGTPEVVADGATGVLVPPGDPAALARTVAELLADDPRRLKMGAAARARMFGQFSFSAQAAAYRNLFESLRSSESARCLTARPRPVAVPASVSPSTT
jgi:glycosyltransferase involved in cell wall biosynthesis